ncbi:MAG: NADH:flavin oxidoreductase/NADH oxidase [SAR202 cluster bacterium]|nr:NADH:flavin oxidoreductase/NADH oxidase [SAR202 cluster bacterium]
MSLLFSTFTLRGETIPNRVFVSPMCQYSSETQDGKCGPWHVVHCGTRAVGGAGLVMMEATAVQAQGRITPWDLGLWSDNQIESFLPVVEAITQAGAVPAIQLAHAGRKASRHRPWLGGGLLSSAEGGWEIVAPSPLRFDEKSGMPAPLTTDEIQEVVAGFASAARRAVAAGMKVIELHMAHGYLGCEFLSPLSNTREDEYGGSLENRARFALQAAQTVRQAIPDGMPLFVRVSATEYVEGGWDVDECVQLCRWLKESGVDLIDCSSGGNSAHQRLKAYPGYQVGFAARIRHEANIPTGAVGLITAARQAEQILSDEDADVVLLGRELLRNPYWPIHAREELDGASGWPPQYARVREIRQPSR